LLKRFPGPMLWLIGLEMQRQNLLGRYYAASERLPTMCAVLQKRD